MIFLTSAAVIIIGNILGEEIDNEAQKLAIKLSRRNYSISDKKRCQKDYSCSWRFRETFDPPNIAVNGFDFLYKIPFLFDEILRRGILNLLA